jgi:hypothetical protein
MAKEISEKEEFNGLTVTGVSSVIAANSGSGHAPDSDPRSGAPLETRGHSRRSDKEFGNDN